VRRIELKAGAEVELVTKADLDAAVKSVTDLLRRPSIQYRRISAFGETPSLPALVAVGAPPDGQVWEVRGLTLLSGDVSTPIANVAAGVFIGGRPDAVQPNWGDCDVVDLPIPTSVAFPGRSLIALSRQMVYVVVQGSGAIPMGLRVNLRVLAVPDHPEALNWL